MQVVAGKRKYSLFLNSYYRIRDEGNPERVLWHIESMFGERGLC